MLFHSNSVGFSLSLALCSSIHLITGTFPSSQHNYILQFTSNLIRRRIAVVVLLFFLCSVCDCDPQKCSFLSLSRRLPLSSTHITFDSIIGFIGYSYQSNTHTYATAHNAVSWESENKFFVHFYLSNVDVVVVRVVSFFSFQILCGFLQTKVFMLSFRTKYILFFVLFFFVFSFFLSLLLSLNECEQETWRLCVVCWAVDMQTKA